MINNSLPMAGYNEVHQKEHVNHLLTNIEWGGKFHRNLDKSAKEVETAKTSIERERARYRFMAYLMLNQRP